MPQTKIQGKFYPLQHEEFLRLNKRLTHSELAVYFWLKTNNPFDDKPVEADTKTIAIDLNISRRSVQRALIKLSEAKLIDLAISKFHYRVKSSSTNKAKVTEIKERLNEATPMSPSDTHVAEVSPMSPKCHPCRQSDTHVAEVSPMSPSPPETKSEQGFQTPKTIKTYIDFIKTLSEREREDFFEFVEKAIKNLTKPINDLEAWLASKTMAGQNRWEVYYNNFQEFKLLQKAERVEKSVENNALAKWQAQIEEQRKRAEKAWESQKKDV